MIAQRRVEYNPVSKPVNLQNSAVLRMLEEEEESRQRDGQPGAKRVTWPPPSEDEDFDFVEQSPVTAKTRGIGQVASYQNTDSLSASETNLEVNESPSPTTMMSKQPSSFYGQQSMLKGWSSGQNLSQSQYRPISPSGQPFNANSTQHASATAYGTPQQGTRNSPIRIFNETSSTTLGSQYPMQQQPSHYYQQPQLAHHTQTFGAPPSTITLRPEPPISQSPAPVYQAQPAATKAPASGTMRGDMKWPPASVKAQTEAENRARLELAKGPVFRPRRVNKDYSGFFAQHALNSSYPGYRAPPGTQYFSPPYQH